jgi:hypothetical protein
MRMSGLQNARKRSAKEHMSIFTNPSLAFLYALINLPNYFVPGDMLRIGDAEVNRNTHFPQKQYSQMWKTI